MVEIEIGKFTLESLYPLHALRQHKRISKTRESNDEITIDEVLSAVEKIQQLMDFGNKKF